MSPASLAQSGDTGSGGHLGILDLEVTINTRAPAIATFHASWVTRHNQDSPARKAGVNTHPSATDQEVVVFQVPEVWSHTLAFATTGAPLTYGLGVNGTHVPVPAFHTFPLPSRGEGGAKGPIHSRPSATRNVSIVAVATEAEPDMSPIRHFPILLGALVCVSESVSSGIVASASVKKRTDMEGVAVTV